MGIEDIGAAKARELLEQSGDELSVLDVRTPEENKQEKIAEGHLIDITKGGFKERVMPMKRDKTYLVYCRTGSRSRFAVNIMRELGFKSIYHLQDGILEWKENGFPTK